LSLCACHSERSEESRRQTEEILRYGQDDKMYKKSFGMKLQFKLALYNALTKGAIIVFLGILILFFIRSISINHIQQRLKEKRTKIINHLSEPEIRNFIKRQGNYTDYNLLREEYFTLTAIAKIANAKERFVQEKRVIDGYEAAYEILTQDFVHNGHNYRLELGESLATLDLLGKTISRFTILVLLLAAIITLISDLFFSKYLLSPFYKIIDEKINRVKDPTHFSYQPIKTSTADFLLLDESISMLMNKFRILMLGQKEFIANVSHELLTPISVLSVRMENLLNEETLTQEGENKLFASLKTLSRLKGIINSLLMISRIENEQFLRDDDVSVNETVKDVVHELEYRLLMKGLEIKIELQKDYLFKGNASLFNSLVTNLVGNAIKYNVQDGKITISSKSENGLFELLISDTGIGMEQPQVENIFDRFEKLHATDEESYGLGLAIVKHIADFHQININIYSVLGKGATVSLKFNL
jgi:signal transduction histidine kinase